MVPTDVVFTSQGRHGLRLLPVRFGDFIRQRAFQAQHPGQFYWVTVFTAVIGKCALAPACDAEATLRRWAFGREPNSPETPDFGGSARGLGLKELLGMAGYETILNRQQRKMPPGCFREYASRLAGSLGKLQNATSQS